MPKSKQIDLSDAISRYVPDGSTVAMGTAQESCIPFAVGHEIIRQGKRNLTLIGPISDILFDQIIGAGCVRKIQAAWVGNVITGSGYNFRRAVENGFIEVEDHSILTLTSALTAGKMGVPYMPAKTALGSDLFRTHSGLKVIRCPFSGETLTAVKAIAPDITVIHAPRSDEYGNAHAWGNLGVTREACLAARRVIVTAEVIVASGVIRSDPNRVVVPGICVDAVVHYPWGGHPSPVPGHYNRDDQAFLDYREASKTPDEFAAWRKRWVDGVAGHTDYLQRLGSDRIEALKIKEHLNSAPADFGY